MGALYAPRFRSPRSTRPSAKHPAPVPGSRVRFAAICLTAAALRAYPGERSAQAVLRDRACIRLIRDSATLKSSLVSLALLLALGAGAVRLPAQAVMAPPAVAATVDSTWDKPAPDTRSFNRGGLGRCGPDGSRGDAATNHRKNRVDEPALYHPVSFDALLALPYPPNHLARRDEWPAADLAVIAPYEGEAVSVTAFVARRRGVIVQDARSSRSGESTNCHALDDAGVDWHVTLVKRAGDPKWAGIVVETTPRVRARGHSWTPRALRAAAVAGDSVRISGWLLYDPEHFPQTRNYDPSRPAHGPTVRATLWEIHPVTRIELFDARTARWRTLP